MAEWFKDALRLTFIATSIPR